MENNYQEQILENIVDGISNRQSGYSQLQIITTIKDCFAISRIEAELYHLSTLHYSDDLMAKITTKSNELDAILKKYPEAVKPTK